MHLLVAAMILSILSAVPSATLGAEPEGSPGARPGELAVQDGAPSGRPSVAASDEGRRPKLLGAQLSAGVPQGFVASAVIQPVRWLRGSLGFAHNVVGPGVQGSVTAIPFRSAVSPTITLEAGHFFETDVSDRLSEYPGVFDASLRRFGYDFYSAQVGLELGSRRGLLFFLRGGVAWMRSRLDAVQGYHPDGARTTVDASGLKLRAAVPTVSLGTTLYVW